MCRMSQWVYGDAIRDHRVAERVRSPEFALRFFLIISATAFAWYFLELEILPYWVAAYYSAVFLEKSIVARNPRSQNGVFLGLLMILGFTISAIYSYLPVYLWKMHTQIAYFGAMAMLVGGTLNIFMLRARIWQLGVAYMLPISCAFFVIAFEHYVPGESGPQFWLAILLSVMMTIYFAVSLWESYLSARRLREARAQFVVAQKADALGRLSGGIAHDFNNLLSVIRGNLELTQMSNNANERAEFVHDALEATDRGAELTRQLLAYAREADLNSHPVSVNEMLRSVQSLARRVIPSSIEFTVVTAIEDIRVLADKTSIMSAILNLVINARDAMPKGGNLQVCARRLSSHERVGLGLDVGDYVAIQVSDTGEGISEDIMPKIFDPFFTTKSAGQGTGLGLPMVYGLAHQMGGTVQIESRENIGTSVEVILPILRLSKERMAGLEPAAA